MELATTNIPFDHLLGGWLVMGGIGLGTKSRIAPTVAHPNVVPEAAAVPDRQAPSVSIVIPCYNAEQWIARAIGSVLDQDYPALEVIVVDDGSTDRSREALETFGDRIRLMATENHGAPSARNLGMRVAQGEYVLFFDADDYLDGPHIAALLDVALNAPVDLVIGRSVTESPDGVRSRPLEIDAPMSNEQLIRHWLKGQCVQTGGMLWRKSFLERIGGWDETVTKEDDVELVLRALLRGARFRTSNKGWVVWCDRDEPQRISRRDVRGGLKSNIEYRFSLATEAQERMPPVVNDFAENLYRVAYGCFVAGYDDLGRESLAACRALGYRRHVGPRFRRGLSAVFGLRSAVHIEQWLQTFRAALPPAGRGK